MDKSDRQPETPLAKVLPPATHRPHSGGFLLGRLLFTQAALPPRPAQ
ncbi:hypothetical protein ACFWPK_31380 [Nocardia sp. NPDC058519]